MAIKSRASNLSWIMDDQILHLVRFRTENVRSELADVTGIATAIE